MTQYHKNSHTIGGLPEKPYSSLTGRPIILLPHHCNTLLLKIKNAGLNVAKPKSQNVRPIKREHGQ